MDDGVVELSTRSLAGSYVAGMQIGKQFNYEFIRESKERRGHRRQYGRGYDYIFLYRVLELLAPALSAERPSPAPQRSALSLSVALTTGPDE